MILTLYLLASSLVVIALCQDSSSLPTGSDRISALNIVAKSSALTEGISSKGGSMGSTDAAGGPLPLMPSKLSRTMEMRSKFGPKDYVSDLNNLQPTFKTPFGAYQALTMVEFPALEGNSIAVARLVLEPCGLMVPHFHQRATEMVYILNGVDIKLAFMEEADGKKVENEKLMTGQVTFFPMGLVHYVQNLGCEKAEFLLSYNNEDPGLYLFVKLFEHLPIDALEAIFNLTEDQIKSIKSGIAEGPFMASKECQKKCGKDGKDGKKNSDDYDKDDDY